MPDETPAPDKTGINALLAKYPWLMLVGGLSGGGLLGSGISMTIGGHEVSLGASDYGECAPCPDCPTTEAVEACQKTAELMTEGLRAMAVACPVGPDEAFRVLPR